MTALADVTIIDRIFVGAGFGYGILNNPSGPVLHIRAGAYPIMHFSDFDSRRRGLSLSFDMRMYFTGDPYGTITQVMGSIAYECY